MKKFLAIILAFAMLLSLTACGGKETPEESTTPTDSAANESVPETKEESTKAPEKAPEESKDEESADDESAVGNEDEEEVPMGGDSIVMWYGANYYGLHEATFYRPDGAYIDEDDLADYYENGSTARFHVYDDVREYSAFGNSYWSRELSTDEPAVYEVLPQLYFYGELDEKNAEDYPTYSYNVTDLGFQWEGLDMMLIEVSYTSAGDFEYNDVFVGVECEELYWRAKEGGGIEENLTAPMLVGFDISTSLWDGMTPDQYAWIAGQLFGVDSGRTWTLEGEEETEAPVPVVNVDASELLGTWLQRDSDWDDTFIFYADGTGMLISGPEYPYTYEVSGDTLTIIYGPDDEEEFTISVDGDLLTMIDQWGYELLLDRQAEEEPEVQETEPSTEEPTEEVELTLAEEIIGTWCDNSYGETYIFNADSTGSWSVDGETYTFTYKLTDGYMELTFDVGEELAFDVEIYAGQLIISGYYIYDRQ